MRYQHLLLEGAPAVRLHGAAGDSVTVLLRGAQVISWTDASGTERLYRSPTSPLAGPQAVRGGVPVVFPQLGPHGPLPRHGFARTQRWALDTEQPPHKPPALAAAPQITLLLEHAAADTPAWPHACVCQLHIALLPDSLHMALAVHNTGPGPLRFQAALHTYLAVGAVGALAQARLAGVLPQGAMLPLAQPIDTVFADTPGPLQLDCPLGPLHIAHAGFPDVVVWNPGPAHGLPDLPPQGATQFVCVEAAVVAQPISLPAQTRWLGSQTLRSPAALAAK